MKWIDHDKDYLHQVAKFAEATTLFWNHRKKGKRKLAASEYEAVMTDDHAFIRWENLMSAHLRATKEA